MIKVLFLNDEASGEAAAKSFFQLYYGEEKVCLLKKNGEI